MLRVNIAHYARQARALKLMNETALALLVFDRRAAVLASEAEKLLGKNRVRSLRRRWRNYDPKKVQPWEAWL